ncbi:MAG: TonB-dependent receptor, partial [Bacteroidota bacterium]
FFLLVVFFNTYSQNEYAITGKVVSGQTKLAISNYTVGIEGTKVRANSDVLGKFTLSTELMGDYMLSIDAPDFVSKRIPITLKAQTLNLGIIYLEKDITVEKTENLIALTDSDLSDDETTSITSGLLQASKDIFLNRAAFDFGQAFFRVRGYGSENGKVLINGIPMNKLFDGRPQWNNWGGLNDVIRNQEFTHGLSASNYNFGGVLGTTNIDTRPSGLRPGFRFSVSTSNRTYHGRLMATYSSGIQDNGLSYSISASRRWAAEGYIEGTLYDAYSFFGALEYKFNPKHSLGLTSFIASNRRGRSAPITEEVFDLVGRRYNPYWGNQNGDIRNSRERRIQEPVLMFNHYYTSNRFNLTTGIAYQFGKNTRSRLGYYNAPNPDPVYYRYLPSFYINSPIGANFISANLARDGFLQDPQVDWTELYTANSGESANGRAAYVLYDDTVEDNLLAISSSGNLKINNRLQIDFGVNYKSLKSDNFAQIKDLLGADFHEDIDPFSDTRNDLNSDLTKENEELFNYNYTVNATTFDVFAQLGLNFNKWNGFISGAYTHTDYQRDGLFLNERFLDNSFGASEKVQFSNYGFKGGFTYKIDGRHWITAHGGYLIKAPLLQNVFVNPRESNQLVPDIQSEKITTTDVNYFIRLPQLTGRITGFYTRFQDITDINFFFVESGVGSDFVQEVLTNLDKLHLGTELGLEYQVSSAVKLSAVAAIGKYVYASDPNVKINFDTAGNEEDLINVEGNIDLGVANIKDLKLAQGPQSAYALGVEYRDPKYWWVGATANYLGNNYTNISTITRTQSFFLDPETQLPFPNATEENVNNLLTQIPLDNFYLLNIVGGKSWLVDGKYISVFASINNVFDTVFRTGGFEQSRNGNFGELSQDNVSGSPSFGPKFWYGYGRTFFINVAVSF